MPMAIAILRMLWQPFPWRAAGISRLPQPCEPEWTGAGLPQHGGAAAPEREAGSCGELQALLCWQSSTPALPAGGGTIPSRGEPAAPG